MRSAKGIGAQFAQRRKFVGSIERGSEVLVRSARRSEKG
jgi:hypothetical protein